MAPWADPMRFASNNFDAIRLCLATLVLFVHSFAITVPVSEAGFWFVKLGAFAVNSFFIISGFLITHSLRRSASVGEYLRKRVLRIYPAFLVVSILDYLLLAPAVAPAGTRVLTWANTASSLLRAANLQEFTPPQLFGRLVFNVGLNASLWSIRYEFGCYLVLLALLWPGRWYKSLAVVAPVLLLVGASFVAFRGASFYPKIAAVRVALVGVPSIWFRVLPYFLVGSLFYHFRWRIPFSTPAAAVSMIGLCGAYYLGVPEGLQLHTIFLCYPIFWVAYHPKIRLTRFGKFGDFSYGTYVFGWPIQLLLVTHFGFGTYAVLLTSVPLALIAGVTSWFGVERPFLLLKKRARRMVEEVPVPAGESPDEAVATAAPPAN